MALNYSEFVIWEGSKQGLLQVHHEFVVIQVEDETTTTQWNQVAAMRVKRRQPQNRDELTITTSGGGSQTVSSDDIDAIVAVIPRSFHLGW